TFSRNILFFSSPRRHTRSKRDWSSDVCSSDLTGEGVRRRPRPTFASGLVTTPTTSCSDSSRARRDGTATSGVPAKSSRTRESLRSEERRVGKEYRCGGTREREWTRINLRKQDG